MIYTFYSYRGGIGRSTSLANVAECFYLRGLKVIVVDWDLEFPGLESYFFETTDGEQVVQSRPGLVDMLIEYRRSFTAATPSAGEPVPERESTADFSSDDEPKPRASRADTDFAGTLDQRMPALSTYLVPVRSADADNGQGGSLSLLPAGLRSDEHPLAYAQAVRALNWNELFASHHGKELFDWLREKLLQAADVVLIDAPTGVSEAGRICLRQLADVVVCFCTPISEDLDAIADVVERSRSAETIEARGHRPLETVVLPVLLVEPQPEEVGELERRLDRLADTLPKPLQEQGLRLWDVRIPYHPQLSFRERLFVGREGGGAEAEPMEAVYWTLASRLALLAPPDHAIARPFERAQETPPASPDPEIVAPAVPVIEQPEAAPLVEEAAPVAASSVEEAAPVTTSSVEEAAPVVVAPVEATPPVATSTADVASLAEPISPAVLAPPAEPAASVESEPPRRVPAARPASIEPSVPPVAAAPEIAGIRLPPQWGWPAAAVSALFLGVVVYLGARGSSGDRAAAERAPEAKPAITAETRSTSDPPVATGTPQPPQERADHPVDIGSDKAPAGSAPPQDPAALPGLYLRVGRGPSCPRIVNYRKQFLAAGMADAKAVTLKSGGCALVLGPYGADIVERRRKEHNALHIRGFDTAVTVDSSDFDQWL